MPSRNEALGNPADSLGARLREIRHRAALTQVELGVCLGHAQSVIARWEDGRLEPRVVELIRLAEVLAVSPDELLVARAGPGRTRSGRRRDVAQARRLGLALRLARLDRGLDLYPAARRARIAPRRLRQIEQGADPSLDELRRLCAVVEFRLAQHAASANLDDLRRVHTVQPDPPTRPTSVPPPDRTSEGKTEA